MSDLTNQDDIDELSDATSSSTVADEKDISLDEETPSEAHDIDEELEKVGLKGDEESFKPLGEVSKTSEE